MRLGGKMATEPDIDTDVRADIDLKVVAEPILLNMPYIEIILDGLHDFKDFFEPEEFKKYCKGIEGFPKCDDWMKSIYKNFHEDNLFCPLVKSKSNELIKNGTIHKFDETVDHTQYPLEIGRGNITKKNLTNYYISRNILGGTKHDAGRGLSHIRDRPVDSDVLYSTELADAIGKDDNCPTLDQDIHPKLIYKSISTLIDPADATSLEVNNFNTSLEFKYINRIYDGYFEFFNQMISGAKGTHKIRLMEYLDTSKKCNKIRFAIYIANVSNLKEDQQKKQTEQSWVKASVGAGNDAMNFDTNSNRWQLNLDKHNEHLISNNIFLCNTQSKSTFTINNIKHSLKQFLAYVAAKKLNRHGWTAATSREVETFFLDAVEAEKDKRTSLMCDSSLIIFFCKITFLLTTFTTNELNLFYRLAFTFKLIGDRGQAWWVWQYNKLNVNAKIMLATGDRGLMMFAISIGIPAVWSALGNEIGLNYYYFPNVDDDIDIKMGRCTHPPPVILRIS